MMDAELVAIITELQEEVERLKTIEQSGPFLSVGSSSELTISSGAITVTGSYHSVDTESDAATDDLETVNGGSDGAILILRAANDARTVVCKDFVAAPDNLLMAGDFSLTSVHDSIIFFHDTGFWIELSRSDNLA